MNRYGDNSSAGTGIKININMDPIDGHHMGDVDFFAEVFSDSASYRKIRIEKAEAIKVDEDNFIVPVDTSKIGAGNYYVKLTAMIPDGDFPDGIRREVKIAKTGITIDL